LRAEVANGEALLARENAIRERWAQMRTNALAGEPSVAENQVFKAFERWAQDSRITINSIKPQWKKPADDFMTLECSVEANGNISALTRFLYNIERDPLAIRITAMQITARDDSGEQLTLNLQVSALLLLTQTKS
ncbi:MAG: GspMb/PilO family protein, partial [Verrucomicrobiales bacterium]|nr:GspMb/PilO family protein [Verrucomicrobiales bacterium]